MTTDWSKYTVVDLRQELKSRGLSQAGKKADLVERLTVDDQEAQTSQPEGDAAPEAEQEEDKEQDKEETKDQDQEAEATTAQAVATASEDEATKSPVKAPSQEPEPKAAAAAPAPEQVAPQEKTATTQDATQTETDVQQEEPDKPTKESAAEPAPEANNDPEVKEDMTAASEEKVEESAPTESAPVAPELTSDTSSRKRRSRSPPPEEETARKRVRPTEQGDEDTRMGGMETQPNETVLPLDDEQDGKDVSYATIHPEIPHAADSKEEVSEMRDAPQDREASEPRDSNDRDHKEEDSDDRVKMEDGHIPQSPNRPAYDDRSNAKYEGDMDIDERNVAPAQHPATEALYIKNFMRPLRDQFLLDHLAELAAPPGNLPDPDAIRDLFIDQIRTHAFVTFTSVTAASRVRVALHGQIWPNERNRKELWVDFIPPDRVAEWVETERSEGGRGNLARWEVRYERDEETGDITTRLVNADLEPTPAVIAAATARGSVSSAREPLPPPVIPSGPAAGRGIEGAPSGPRGRGGRVPQPALTGDEMKATRTHPSLLYRPVNAELAERRIQNMRSFYTRDRRRDMGREDEINRYTFEDNDSFVDRGKEVFVGIRPPHREAERRRGRMGGGDGGRGGPPPPPFGRSRGGDRYLPGVRDDPPPRRGGGGGDRGDEPRSRFDGAPLPTFEGGPPRRRRRGHGGGGGGGGGGGFRGDRY
ncbi:hypothetical protein B0T20DRAFT_176408 [Sordaria brevicollis]|uniref:SAP domain-containing protein n=1 Tax=Sordaria brevicollis TaxID=83679 RepID=A0AAE0PHR2_SORBR|nr:hypothetical protein B0T20DRAFT_176408 [Sordaria brevicollis]